MKNRKIIAVDFDGTLCSNNYPSTGIVRMKHKRVHDFIKQQSREGNIIILWTCRTGEALETAVRWCEKQGLHIDYVNENEPELLARFGNDCRKIYADIYVDDKAFNPFVKVSV